MDATGETLTAADHRTGVIEFIEDPVFYKWDSAAGEYVYAELGDISATWDVRRLEDSKLFIYHDTENELAFMPYAPSAGPGTTSTTSRPNSTPGYRMTPSSATRPGSRPPPVTRWWVR